MEAEVKPRKPMIDDLFRPLSEKYQPTEADRERLQAKIHARIAASGASAQASARSASRPGFSLSSFRRWGWLGSGVLALAGMALTVAVHEGGDASKSRETVSRGPLVPATTTTETVTPESAPLASAPAIVDHPAEPSESIAVAAPPASAASVKRAEPARAASNQMPKTVAAVPAESDALERETNLWRQANRARNDGQWAEALRLLDQHAREFPNGVLAVERTVERIVVLCHMGRREEARESSAFLATHPDSSLRRRVESNCGYEAASPPSTSSSARSQQEPDATPKNTPPGTLTEGPEQAP